jgi:molybdenum cofactor biosynthesis protein B
MKEKIVDFQPLNIAVITVSDTRNEETDSSGQYLVTSVTDAGHQLIEKVIVKDDIYVLRALVSRFIAADNVHVVLLTGGTGFTARDNTPQALVPLMDRRIEGFGELFRQLSYQEIGTSTLQSRAVAGISNYTALFCLPGSTGACRTAWEGILKEQLDRRHRPCNFVAQLLKPKADAVSGLASGVHQTDLACGPRS